MDNLIYITDKEFIEKGYIMRMNDLIIDGKVEYKVVMGDNNGIYVVEEKNGT